MRSSAEGQLECGKLKTLGKSDWRLPTLKELESIVDSTSHDPSINKKFFPKSTDDPYWTDTTPGEFQGQKYTVLFSDGSVYHVSSGSAAATRCVRTGK